MSAAVVAMTLFAAATAVGSGRAVRPVRTAAPVESEGGHLVAYGRSRLLVVQPTFVSEDRGSISRINLNGSLDRSFGEDGEVKIASEDAAVTGDGKILVATTSNPSETAAKTKARITRLLPDGQLDRSFGVDGHADIHFGPRWDYAEAVATAADGDILVAGIMVEYSSNYGDEVRLAVARLKPDGTLDHSFGKNGIDLLRSWGEIGVFDVTPTPSGGTLVEGGNEIETFLWELNRNGSVDRRFGKGGYREIRGRPEGNGYNEELSLAPSVIVLPSSKVLLAATGSRLRGPGPDFRMVAVRLRPDGRVDRSYGRNGWALDGREPGEAVGTTLLPGGDLAVATTFEGVAAKGHPFGAVAFRPDGRLDRRFGQRGRCRARLRGRGRATGVAVVDDHAVVGGEGYPGAWLLNCPPVSGR